VWYYVFFGGGEVRLYVRTIIIREWWVVLEYVSLVQQSVLPSLANFSS